MTGVVSHLKAEVNLLQIQSSGDHMQDPNDDKDEVTENFPTRTVLNELDSYLQSIETNLVNAFQNLPTMKKIFVKYNTGVKIGNRNENRHTHTTCFLW